MGIAASRAAPAKKPYGSLRQHSKAARSVRGMEQATALWMEVDRPDAME
jgi:hypothetical protein